MFYLQNQLHNNWGQKFFDQKLPQILQFDPQVPIHRVPPTCYAIYIEEYLQGFSLMYFCDNYLFFNGPNFGDFSIILIYLGSLFVKIWIFTPGVPIYRVPTSSYAIDIEHIASRFNLNVFLWSLCPI